MTSKFSAVRLSHLAAILGAGAALAFAAPVQAQENDNQQRVAPRVEGGGATERRICRRVEFTGSRMVRRVCRTQAEWSAQDAERD